MNGQIMYKDNFIPLNFSYLITINNNYYFEVWCDHKYIHQI